MNDNKNYRPKVYEYLLTIPYGKVVTYKTIAIHLGDIHLARYVGSVLHSNPRPDFYPCYKVVNSKGKLAINFGDGGLTIQKERLEKEGIVVIDNIVDLKKYEYKGKL